MYHTVWDGHILWYCINVQLQRRMRLKKFLQRVLRRLEVEGSDSQNLRIWGFFRASKMPGCFKKSQRVPTSPEKFRWIMPHETTRPLFADF